MDKVHLEVENLKTYFFTRRGVEKAVDGVSFSVNQAQTFGRVGESGCGKSVSCLSILRLVPEPAGRIVGGRILLGGENLLEKTEDKMRKIRGSRISMILQDPMTSLNPVFTIGDQLFEALQLHRHLKGQSLLDRGKELLKKVGIASPEFRLRNYPHELSGGMKQRVVGAIALSCEPHLLICDEPTTSLDVTIQAQYLRLLKELQQQAGLTMIFVTHDFGIVARMCDRVGVMYAGRMVEVADCRELFNNPTHPYTKALMSSVPKLEMREERLLSIEGEPPALYNLPTGCSFAPRCTSRSTECKMEEFPPSVEVGDGHWVNCWRYG